MFPYPIAKPQKCDIQTFYGSSTEAQIRNQRTWNKPVGVSHVYMLLIGAGGSGAIAGQGGGSGAVTVWYGAAQHVPDVLIIQPGATNEGFDTAVSYRSRGTNLISLLSAPSSLTTTAGAAATAGPFAASGFFKSTAGQNGDTGVVSASPTTFLSPGTAASNIVNANYGYKNAGSSSSTAADGFFQLQPIIVGVGGSGAFNGGVGCGGGAQASVDTGYGGPGMVLIASW